jgi:hypothetical protein
VNDEESALYTRVTDSSPGIEFVKKWPLQSLRGAEGAVAISTRRLLRFARNDVVKVKCNNSQAHSRTRNYTSEHFHPSWCPDAKGVWRIPSIADGIPGN